MGGTSLLPGGGTSLLHGGGGGHLTTAWGGGGTSLMRGGDLTTAGGGGGPHYCVGGGHLTTALGGAHFCVGGGGLTTALGGGSLLRGGGTSLLRGGNLTTAGGGGPHYCMGGGHLTTAWGGLTFALGGGGSLLRWGGGVTTALGGGSLLRWGGGGLTTAFGGGGLGQGLGIGGGTKGGYNLGGWVQPGPPPSPPWVTKKVMVFGHKKSGLKPVVLGSPQPIHVPPPPSVQTNGFVLKKYAPNGSIRWTRRSVRATILRNGVYTSLGTRYPAHSKHKRWSELAPRAWGPPCSWHRQKWQPDLAQGPSGQTLLVGTFWPGAGRESVMVGNRGPLVEGHHSVTSCFTNLPTVTHYKPSFPQFF